MCNTVVGEPFQEFVRERIEQRNRDLAVRHDLDVAVDPEIMAVIQNSTAVSTMTGNAAHLLKVGSKRRRTKAEMEEHREMQERSAQ